MGTTVEHIIPPLTVSNQPQGNLPLASSVLGALVYADLFDAPLSLVDIHRYQIASHYSLDEIAAVLNSETGLLASVSSDGTYYCLKGREAVFATRQERAKASERVWKRARLYSRWLRRLPFVRMVAVTGALAVNNVNGRHDIDLLVIARPGRVWLCRRGLIFCVRLGRLVRDDLCPNYILSEESLELSQRDFFTAHELAQMVPVFGQSIYGRMQRANAWAATYLPSSQAGTVSSSHRNSDVPASGLVEKVLRKRTFDGWERWELERLQRKLRLQAGRDSEVVLTPDQCKGHTGLHRAAVMTRYMSRLSEMGLHDVIAALEEAQMRTAQGT